MDEPIRPDKIDPIVHERVRLAIVSALAVTSSLSFGELKESLDLTDGNLSAHLQTLEKAGYVKVKKSFRARRPLTEARLTAKGRRAFTRYLDTLRCLIDDVDDGDCHAL